MKKKYPYKLLDDDEKIRLLEVRTFYKVRHFFSVFTNRLDGMALIEILSMEKNLNINTLKKIISSILQPNSPLEPTREETIVLYYRDNVPVSAICRTLDITSMTVYKFIQEYLKDPSQVYLPRLKWDVQGHVEELHNFLERLYNYDGY